MTPSEAASRVSVPVIVASWLSAAKTPDRQVPESRSGRVAVGARFVSSGRVRDASAFELA